MEEAGEEAAAQVHPLESLATLSPFGPYAFKVEQTWPRASGRPTMPAKARSIPSLPSKASQLCERWSQEAMLRGNIKESFMAGDGQAACGQERSIDLVQALIFNEGPCKTDPACVYL